VEIRASFSQQKPGERTVSSIPFISMNVHHALFNVRTVDLIQQLIERHGIGGKIHENARRLGRFWALAGIQPRPRMSAFGPKQT
jgi:hypothetical protein